MKICSLDKLVKGHLEYIESITGDYPLDWLTEVAEQSKDDVYHDFPEYTTEEKWGLIDDNVSYHVSEYIDFIRENYPERIKKEA